MIAIKDKRLKYLASISPLMASYLSSFETIPNFIINNEYDTPLKNHNELKKELKSVLKIAKSELEVGSILKDFSCQHRFIASFHLLQNISTINRINSYLADLAEIIIAAAIAHIKDKNQIKDEFAIIAIGSLGMGQFAIDSDIDIFSIYCAHKIQKQTNFDKLAKEIINLITQKGHACTQIYKIDTELKLGGKNTLKRTTPLAELKSALDHKAPSWEAINIVKSRIIGPDTAINNDIKLAIIKLLKRRISASALNAEFMRNSSQIKRRFYKSNAIYDYKFVSGGLFDISLIIKYLSLISHNENVLNSNSLQTITQLHKSNLLTAKQALILKSTYKLLHKCRSVSTLLAMNASSSAKEKDLYANIVLGLQGIATYADLEEILTKSLLASTAIYNEVFKS